MTSRAGNKLHRVQRAEGRDEAALHWPSAWLSPSWGCPEWTRSFQSFLTSAAVARDFAILSSGTGKAERILRILQVETLFHLGRPAAAAGNERRAHCFHPLTGRKHTIG